MEFSAQMWSNALVIVVAVVAGAIAAVTGFGIGSLLTPVLALQVDTRLAVAAVSVPHVIGTALRFWLLRGGIDRGVRTRRWPLAEPRCPPGDSLLYPADASPGASSLRGSAV